MKLFKTCTIALVSAAAVHAADLAPAVDGNIVAVGQQEERGGAVGNPAQVPGPQTDAADLSKSSNLDLVKKAVEMARWIAEQNLWGWVFGCACENSKVLPGKAAKKMWDNKKTTMAVSACMIGGELLRRGMFSEVVKMLDLHKLFAKIPRAARKAHEAIAATAENPSFRGSASRAAVLGAKKTNTTDVVEPAAPLTTLEPADNTEAVEPAPVGSAEAVDPASEKQENQVEEDEEVTSAEVEEIEVKGDKKSESKCCACMQG